MCGDFLKLASNELHFVRKKQVKIHNQTFNLTVRSRTFLSQYLHSAVFVGTERVDKSAAAIQSLLENAKLNGLGPAVWLKEAQEKLPTWPNSKIDEQLLPFRNITH